MPLKDVRKIRIPFVRVMGWRPTSSREIMIYINTLHTQLPGRHLTQDATQLTISYTFHFFTHYIFLNILMYLKQLIPPYIIFIPSHQNSDMYHALHPTPRFPFIITPPPTTPNKSLNTPNTQHPNRLRCHEGSTQGFKGQHEADGLRMAGPENELFTNSPPDS